MCGVAVLEKDNGGQIKCWLTHLNEPDGVTPMPGGTLESVVILTRNTTTVPVDERTGGLIFGEGGCTLAIPSRFVALSVSLTLESIAIADANLRGQGLEIGKADFDSHHVRLASLLSASLDSAASERRVWLNAQGYTEVAKQRVCVVTGASAYTKPPQPGCSDRFPMLTRERC